ncbi:MAG: hypothetical protein ACRDV9_08335, partial [Acidimicrobiia bacterium]
GDAVPSGHSDGHPLPIPRGSYPDTVGNDGTGINRVTNGQGLVESRMRGNPHVRFGGRAGETDQPEG